MTKVGRCIVKFKLASTSIWKTKNLNNENKVVSMENLLPEEIILDIFSRLPVKSVLQCRLVCKTWRTLIRPSYFADMHLQRRQLGQFDDDHLCYHNNHSSDGIATKASGLGIIFSIRFIYEDKGNVGFYYGEYDDISVDDQFSYRKLTRINHPPLKRWRNSYMRMVGSCNGLVCFSVPYRHRIRDIVYNHHVYVCNPITREYKRIFDESTKEIQPIVTGFGYLPSSKEYKIVRIFGGGQVQVYTLGSCTGWRNKGKIHGEWTPQYSSGKTVGILANGALHWLDYRKMKIFAFDLADEEFHVVLSPPCFLPAGYDSFEHYFRLKELGNCLCVIHQVRSERVDIWSLKKANNTTCTHSMKEKEYKYWTWMREFSISWEGSRYIDFEPFALTKSNEVILWQNRAILSRYDPKTATLKKLVENAYNMMHFQAIPHVNSFVSLKDLGERKSMKRKRYMRKFS